jgi:Protein of unknown function (DUF2970)
MSDKKGNPQKLTLWQIICSVFAAAFGVQSDKNRERDFKQAKPSTYIIAGLIFTVLFVLAVAAVVNLVLSNAAS